MDQRDTAGARTNPRLYGVEQLLPLRKGRRVLGARQFLHSATIQSRRAARAREMRASERTRKFSVRRRGAGLEARHVKIGVENIQRSEERRVGKECRSRWS